MCTHSLPDSTVPLVLSRLPVPAAAGVNAQVCLSSAAHFPANVSRVANNGPRAHGVCVHATSMSAKKSESDPVHISRKSVATVSLDKTEAPNEIERVAKLWAN